MNNLGDVKWPIRVKVSITQTNGAKWTASVDVGEDHVELMERIISVTYEGLQKPPDKRQLNMWGEEKGVSFPCKYYGVRCGTPICPYKTECPEAISNAGKLEVEKKSEKEFREREVVVESWSLSRCKGDCHDFGYNCSRCDKRCVMRNRGIREEESSNIERESVKKKRVRPKKGGSKSTEEKPDYKRIYPLNSYEPVMNCPLYAGHCEKCPSKDCVYQGRAYGTFVQISIGDNPRRCPGWPLNCDNCDVSTCFYYSRSKVYSTIKPVMISAEQNVLACQGFPTHCEQLCKYDLCRFHGLGSMAAIRSLEGSDVEG